MRSLRSKATLGSVDVGNGAIEVPLVVGSVRNPPGLTDVHVWPALVETAISTNTVLPGARSGSLRTQTAASLFGLSWSIAIVGLLSSPRDVETSTWLFGSTVGVGSTAISVRGSSAS